MGKISIEGWKLWNLSIYLCRICIIDKEGRRIMHTMHIIIVIIVILIQFNIIKIKIATLTHKSTYLNAKDSFKI